MKKIRDYIKLSQLCGEIDGRLTGNDISVYDVAGLEDVKTGQITWVENGKALEKALQSPASALIVGAEVLGGYRGSIPVPCIQVKNPRLAFAQTLQLFYSRTLPEGGIAGTAVTGENTSIGGTASIGEYAVIGRDCVIGNGAVLFPHVYIGDGVEIGEGSIIYPFCAVHDNCRIGRNVIIHSGAVIGADGFGFVEEKGKRVKIPQVGTVIIGDGAEIGANATIDRATTGATVIGAGTKIDNLVMVGHNNRIGRNCVMVSQSGIAGSCQIGDNVTMAAQSGVAPHINIGSNTIVAGRGGVTHDIPGNSIVSGFPAKPHREALRLNGAIQRLPAILKDLKQLEDRLSALEEQIAEKIPS